MPKVDCVRGGLSGARRPRPKERCAKTVIYAIGDIHGQYAMLEALLAKLTDLPIQDDDTFVFLGDYVDRGDDSRAVLERLQRWREEHPNTIFLRGNHEQLMLDVIDAPADIDRAERARRMLIWLQNGGSEALRSYSAPGFRAWLEACGGTRTRLSLKSLFDLKESFERWIEVIPEDDVSFMRATQMEFVTPRYHFVHAGLLTPGQTWATEGWSIDPRLWMREPFVSSRADFGGRTVVFGHTPQRSGRPLVHPNKIGLDTGAVFGGPLTAGIFDPDGAAPPRFIQAPYVRTITSFSPPGISASSAARRRASSARSSRK